MSETADQAIAGYAKAQRANALDAYWEGLRVSRALRECAQSHQRPGIATLLHCAATLGRADHCEELLTMGSPVEARDASGATPLGAACAAGLSSRANHLAIVALLAQGASLDGVDGRGRSAEQILAQSAKGPDPWSQAVGQALRARRLLAERAPKRGGMGV